MKLDLSLDFDKKKFISYSEKLIADGAKCEIKVLRPKRSISQNSYLHVCIGMFCQETGYSLEEGKVVLKRQFGKFLVYEKDGFKFLRSTSDCDTLEITEFLEWIRNEACYNSLGIYVPTSTEYLENQFQIDRQIGYVK